jgi:integrase
MIYTNYYLTLYELFNIMIVEVMKGSVLLMANKKTIAISNEQYVNIVNTIRNGFEYEEDGKIIKFRPNHRMATVMVIQANIGTRIGDIIKLKLNDIIKDGNRWRLDIIEEKTGKTRTFTVPNETYNYIKLYCLEHDIKPTATIFPLTERALQKNLQIVSKHLGYDKISTHSFRKFYATKMYEDNDSDVALVQLLLQHSSIANTQKYIGISNKKVEAAIQKHTAYLI